MGRRKKTAEERAITLNNRFPDQVGDVAYNRAFLESRLDKTLPGGCWGWTGGRHRQGYAMHGAIRVSDHKRLMVTGHRIAMRLKLGRAVNSDEMIMHTCSNMACQNPKHLIVGDMADRKKIMKKNNRYPEYHGVAKVRGITEKQHRNYKWTEDQIRFLRSASLDDIVKEFKVSRLVASQYRYACRSGYRWLKD